MSRAFVALGGAALALAQTATTYTVSDAACAPTGAGCRSLDGVGGLSGGGATSVLLPYYAEPYRR